MRLIFSTRQFTQLSHLPLDQKLILIQQACNRLPAPKKWFINLLKLCIVIPIFALLVKVPDDPSVLIWVFMLLLLIPGLLRPIHFGLAEPYIKLPTKG